MFLAILRPRLLENRAESKHYGTGREWREAGQHNCVILLISHEETLHMANEEGQNLSFYPLIPLQNLRLGKGRSLNIS